jgi:hypothetical protein
MHLLPSRDTGRKEVGRRVGKKRKKWDRGWKDGMVLGSAIK